MATPEIDDIATRNAQHGPNFKLIVALAAGVLLAILLGTYLMFHWDGKQLIPKPDHQTSQLAMPGAAVLSS